MSSLYVRQLVEQWLQDPAMTVPYYPTINEEQSPPDPIWVTADFSSTFRERMTFCEGEEREEGEVELVYMGRPGVGYQPVLAAAETDLGILMAQRDPAGRLIVTNRSAPLEYTRGDAAQDYALSIYLDYDYYT